MPQAAGEPKPPPQEAKPADQPAAAAAPAAPRENRLAKEASLYLRQHGKNPVDWYPWGEEALAKAKKENKLIFLSVGYSSCHWCHVMERESFEDKEIAAYLNKHFVCIKVDREERPEIDAIYMASLQVYMQAAGLGRGGGWPLSMFLTPDGLPFFGHTYLPPRDGDREGLTGFLTIITKLQGVWEKEPKNILTDAETLTKLVKQGLEQRPLLALTPVDAETIDNIQLALFEAFDAKYGGFGVNEEGPSPKFPESPNLVYLVARASHEKLDPKLRAQANQMLQKTLDAIAAGGIYDHLGGGFHRYTVDRAWQIPHFEKMLYDNAQLASVFATAYERFQREQDKLVVRGTLEFVLRELKAPAGGFYSAIDAESEHEEGKFYRWTKEELTTLLSAEERALAGPIYSFDGKPNFEKEFYALQLSAPLAQLAAERKVTVAELDAKLAPIRTKLFDARSQRIRPATDDKILTGMNGQMIRGLADGGRILKEPKYIEAAAQAAEFVWTRLRDDKGRLKRSFAGGAARLNAYLEDYAYFADGLLALHEATGDERWLKRADEVTAKQIELFWDARFGGFFYTSSDHEALLARVKEFSDNAQPAGNSVAVANLLTLSEKLSHKEYRAKAAKTIQCAGGMMQRSPLYAPQLGAAAARWLETETP